MPKPPSSIKPSFSSPKVKAHAENRSQSPCKNLTGLDEKEDHLFALGDVFREVKVPPHLRNVVISSLVKMEGTLVKSSVIVKSEPRHRTYVGNNSNRFQRDKTPMRKPKSLHGVPISLQKQQCQEMREQAAAERQRAAMEVWV
jgi:hypothetical protein